MYKLNKILNYLFSDCKPEILDSHGKYWSTALPECWSYKDVALGMLYIQLIERNSFGIWKRKRRWNHFINLPKDLVEL